MGIQLQSLKAFKPNQLCKLPVYSVYCIQVCTCTPTESCMWKSEDNFGVVSFHLYMGLRSDSDGWAYMANSCICCIISPSSYTCTCHCVLCFYLVISNSSFFCKARSSNSVLLPQPPECRDCRCILSGLSF